MKIDSSHQYVQAGIVRTPVLRAGMLVVALAVSAALFIFSGPSFAQSAAKPRTVTGRTSSAPSVSENVASNPSSNSAVKPASKTATPVAPAAPVAAAATHAPAVAYLLLESAQGPLNGNSTDATHRNWIAVSAIDKGSISDGAAKGQASDAMAYKDSPNSGTNPLYEGKDAMDHKNISDGAAKGQAVDGMAQNQSASGGSGNGHPADAATPGFPALDASSKDAAKMASAPGSSSGSHSGSFSIQKEIDEASPKLRMAASSGGHFSSAQLDVLDGGVWHHYQLSDVTVSSVRSAGGGPMSSEQIQFTYQKIEMK